jgi:hypothetical protein
VPELEPEPASEFNLPVDLSDWLTIVGVAHLDSAYCSHTLREEYWMQPTDLEKIFGTQNRTSGQIIAFMTTWIFARGSPISGFIACEIFLCKHHERTSLLVTRK